MKYNEIIKKFFQKNYKKKYYSNHEPLFSKLENKEVQKCIQSTFVSTAGDYQDLFIKEVSNIVNSNYLVPVNSGTSALHLSAILSEINFNDEVLMPSLTFVATANSVIYVGAYLHFVDVKKETLSVDFEKLEQHLSQFKFKKKRLYNHFTKKFIKALVVVHTYGYSAEMHKAVKVCKKYNLTLIEDATESLGSYFKNKHTGTFGSFGCLSFNGNKIVTTGAGGVIITKNKKDYLKAKKLASVSKKNIPYVFDFAGVGYNYRMPSLNASLGYAQLKNFKKILKIKKKIHFKYKKYFNLFENIYFYSDNKKLYQKSNHWLNTILIDDKEFTKTKHLNFLKDLNHKKINVRPTWKPLHKLNHLKKYYKADLKVTNYLEYKLFNLPSSPNIIFYEK